MKAEENPKLLKTINPKIRPDDEIAKIDEKLVVCSEKLKNPKTTREQMTNLKIEINDLLDKRLEWMKMRKKSLRIVRKK